MVVTVIGIVIAAAMLSVAWARSEWRRISDIGNINVNIGMDDDGLRTSNSRR